MFTRTPASTHASHTHTPAETHFHTPRRAVQAEDPPARTPSALDPALVGAGFSHTHSLAPRAAPFALVHTHTHPQSWGTSAPGGMHTCTQDTRALPRGCLPLPARPLGHTSCAKAPSPQHSMICVNHYPPLLSPRLQPHPLAKRESNQAGCLGVMYVTEMYL